MNNLTLKLNELFGEASSVKIEIVKSYKQQVEESSNSISEYLKDENWEEINKQAHSLKSSSGLLGFHELAELLQNIETECESDTQSESIHQNFEKFKLKAKQVYEECEKLLETLSI